MPKYEELLKNPDLRKKIGYEVIKVINTAMKKELFKPEDVDATVNDPKKVENYIKLSKMKEDNEVRMVESQKIEAKLGIEVPSGFARHYFYFYDPKATPEKNEQMIRDFADPSKMKEIVTNAVSNMYNADMRKAFPLTEAEAIEYYQENQTFVQEAFVLTTMISNNGLNVNPELKQDFESKIKLYQSFNAIANLAASSSNIMSTILPEGMTPDIYSTCAGPLLTLFKDLSEKGIDGVQIDDLFNEYTLYGTSYEPFDYEKNAKLREYFDKEAVNGEPYLLTHTCDGDLQDTLLKEVNNGKLDPNSSVHMQNKAILSKTILEPVNYNAQLDIAEIKAMKADFMELKKNNQVSFLENTADVSHMDGKHLLMYREIGLERQAKRGIWAYTLGIVHTIRENLAMSRINDAIAREFTPAQSAAYHQALSDDYDTRKIRTLGKFGIRELPEEAYEAECDYQENMVPLLMDSINKEQIAVDTGEKFDAFNEGFDLEDLQATKNLEREI